MTKGARPPLRRRICNNRGVRARVVILVFALLSSACATSSRLVPNAAEWREAAVHAIKDPDTWVPAALALGVVATDSDHEISDWAADETPLFGSNENAADWSDQTKLAAHLVMLGTAFAPREEPTPLARRAWTAVGNELATIPSDFVTTMLKEGTDRERPDASNRASFPSGHASGSASYLAVTERNLEAVRAGRNAKRATMIAARLLVATTSWARIEARKHYPTDVLVGMALGNLLTSLVDRAFRPSDARELKVMFERRDEGVAVLFTLRLAE